jgi:hypothetical protein
MLGFQIVSVCPSPPPSPSLWERAYRPSEFARNTDARSMPGSVAAAKSLRVDFSLRQPPLEMTKAKPFSVIRVLFGFERKTSRGIYAERFGFMRAVLSEAPGPGCGGRTLAR